MIVPNVERNCFYILFVIKPKQNKFLVNLLSKETFDSFVRLFFLETLVDKENREKLWKIYFGKLNPGDYIKQAEQRRIKNIQKQLSIINRKQILLNDTTSTSTISKINLRRYSSCIETYSHTENRRRSSLDLQMIERWKSIADKTPNRPYKRSSSSNYSQFIPEAEKCHLLTRKVNPYVTYFHLPRPLVTIKSNHQIIQIDDDNQVLNFSKV